MLFVHRHDVSRRHTRGHSGSDDGTGACSGNHVEGVEEIYLKAFFDTPKNMGGIYTSNPAAINAQYSERLTHAHSLFFILRRARVVSVAVASTDLSVHAMNLGV